jgi:Lar family restriction alleviation protein
MEYLKPCPFCGDKEDLEIYVQGSYFGGWWSVICLKCQAEGPSFEGTSNSDSEARIEAINAWNNRKGE